MRIGILTLPLHGNYGGILQAYALQSVLEKMGHKVEVVDRELNWEVPFWVMVPRIIKRCLMRYVIGKKETIIFLEQKKKKEQKIICQHTSQFVNNYIHRRIVKSYNEIKESDYDAIVVGSDQVWRPSYFGEKIIKHAYLDFAKDWKNIKRISYAASFGSEEWEYTNAQTKKCAKLLSLFNCVSVREKGAVKLCKEYFGVKALQVVDPTLLISKEYYIQLFKEDIIERKNTLVTYILNKTKEKQELIDKVSREKEWEIIQTNSSYEDLFANIEKRIQQPVESWLSNLYSADFVITDSFHACLFSLIFNKPFIVLSNKKRGLGRIDSLLTMIQQHYRLIDMDSDIPLKSFDNPNVDIAEYSNESFTYLINSLK